MLRCEHQAQRPSAGWNRRSDRGRQPPQPLAFPAMIGFNAPSANAKSLCSPCAPVAQLDRAPDYESGGREFESLRVCHFLHGLDLSAGFSGKKPNYHTTRKICSVVNLTLMDLVKIWVQPTAFEYRYCGATLLLTKQELLQFCNEFKLPVFRTDTFTGLHSTGAHRIS